MNVAIPCVCPPLTDGQPRHETDTVTLRDRLGFRAALTARNAILVAKQEDDRASVPEILAAMTEAYLVQGVESWTLADQKNKPLPLTLANLREFMDEHVDEAMLVSDAADELYAKAVIDPLVRTASKSSPDTRTASSTSATTGSASTRQKRQKPSSTTTSQTDGTGTMYLSRAGDSN